jgi:hypothetical protein
LHDLYTESADMSDFNPYQSPTTPADQWAGQPDVEAVLYEATQSLAQTKPWVRFLSVLGFLGTGCMVLVFSIGIWMGGMAAGPIEVIILLPMCVLFYFIPSLLLWNYASRISEFLTVRDSRTFSAAIAAQKSFWKYLGILVLIIMIMYGMILAFAALAAFVGAVR